jgi:hypothetical protein
MLGAIGLIFYGTEGVGSIFSCFSLPDPFRGRRFLFSCYALPNSFLTVPGASGLVFLFCAPRLIFVSTEEVGSRFHVLRSGTHFRWYRRRRDPFSDFALPDSFWAVPTATGPIFMLCAPGLILFGTRGVVPVFLFCAPELIFDVTEEVGSRFQVCAPELVLRGTEGVGSRFHVLRYWTHFRWYRRRRVPFSCFALQNSFSTIPWTPGPVFIIYAPRLVFGATEGARSRFHVLLSRTHFW